jgi:hypothetical protein
VDAALATLAAVEQQDSIDNSTASPEFNPVAWRHRGLSEIGCSDGKPSAKNLNPPHAEQTRKASKPPRARAITGLDRRAGLARQQEAREAAKKGGAK